MEQFGENAVAAFDLLLQEISLVVDHERGCGADAFRHGDYNEADKCKQRCRRFADLVKEVAGLRERWSRETARPGSDAVKVGEPAPQVRKGMRMTMAYNGARATATYHGGPVVLLEGSTVRRQVLASLARGLREQRAQYEMGHVLVADTRSDLLMLARSIQFDSPSAAAQFVAGCSVSGNRDWHLEGHGYPLGEYLRKVPNAVVVTPKIAQPICFS